MEVVRKQKGFTHPLSGKVRGFTLIEVVVAVLIVAILAVIVTQAFSNYNNRQALTNAVEKIISVIEDTRSRTLAAESAQQYGVHFETNTLTVFAGSTYSPSDPGNVVYTINSRVAVAASLSGGGSDILFKRLTGATDESGTITASLLSDPLESHVITVQGTGIASLSTP